MRWSYIGELGKDGALDWGGDSSGNIPVTGQFLPDWEDTKLYLKIREYARDGAYHGEHVDWGAFAIKVNGPEMLAILEECYGAINALDPKTLLQRYAAFAQDLGADGYIALISCEM